MKDADIPFDSKHPCILPYNHEISKMIIGDCHEQAHLGVELSLIIVRQKYWIVKARYDQSYWTEMYCLSAAV